MSFSASRANKLSYICMTSRYARFSDVQYSYCLHLLTVDVLLLRLHSNSSQALLNLESLFLFPLSCVMACNHQIVDNERLILSQIIHNPPMSSAIFTHHGSLKSKTSSLRSPAKFTTRVLCLGATRHDATRTATATRQSQRVSRLQTNKAWKS